jgi:cyclopropane-fatty-acyl-phospholipid synthase
MSQAIATRSGVSSERAAVEKLFALADIQVNGDRPFDVRVSDDRFYKRVLRDGQLGIGEAYMDGWWETDRLDEATRRFVLADLERKALRSPSFVLAVLRERLSNIGKKSAAFEVGERHYDLGNDLFRSFLDKRMVYSCAYWKDAATLDQAQENKLDLVCRKLGLKPGMRVLEIGCGWGSWAKFAAENYGVSVVGLTVSKEQAAFARENCAGLPVEFRLQDYRDVDEKFDRVVSIAMFEAVGQKYFRTFMQVVDRCLKDDGLFLLHTIVGNEHVGPAQAPWMNKYIFPNGELPSLGQITAAAENIFVVEALHRLGGDYERTLQCWYDNFNANWSTIQDKYGPRFHRMWNYYLMTARGAFQARIIHLWHVLFSKNGIPGKPSLAVADPAWYESR